MVNEEVTIKLTESIAIIDKEMDEINAALEKKENDIKNQKIKTVETINTLFEPYKGNEVIPAEAWEKLNALHSTYQGLEEKEKAMENEDKVEAAREIDVLNGKKNVLLEALKSFNSNEETSKFIPDANDFDMSAMPELQVEEEKEEEPASEETYEIDEPTIEADNTDEPEVAAE